MTHTPAHPPTATRPRRPPGYYSALWSTMTINRGIAITSTHTIKRMLLYKPRYQTIQAQYGIPWPFTAAVHAMECNACCDRSLFDGQPLHKDPHNPTLPTGSWKHWYDMADDWAEWIAQDKPLVLSIRYIVHLLECLEAYNGWGYVHHGVHSPYLWAGTNHGLNTGKYTANGIYDPKAVSTQTGAAALIALMPISQTDLDRKD